MKASRTRRSLRASTGEGFAAEIANACSGTAVLTAWALYLGAGPTLLGALWALPYFGQLMQFPAAWLTSRLGRRGVAIAGHALSRHVVVLFMGIPLLPISLEAKRAVFIGIVGVSAVLAVIGHNAWVTWVGDLVPARIRGRYFGRRTAICMLGATLASLITGTIMDRARERGTMSTTLAGLAMVGFVCASVATVFMWRQHDPPGAPRVTLAPRDLAHPFAHAPSRRLMLYLAIWGASVGLTASLCAVSMLQVFSIGFRGLAIYGAALHVIRLVAMPVWGTVVDRTGARPVLVVCSLGSACCSALWLLASPTRIWPIALDAAFSGALLSGQDLAVFSISFAIAPKKARPAHLAAYAMSAGIAFGIASVAGGRATESLAALGVPWGASILFAISSLGRMLAGLCALTVAEPGAHAVSRLVPALVKACREKVRDRLAARRTRPTHDDVEGGVVVEASLVPPE